MENFLKNSTLIFSFTIPDKFTKEVMTEDDPVMLELKELDKIDPIDKSSLNVLTKDSIYKNIEKEKLLFILFYLDGNINTEKFFFEFKFKFFTLTPIELQ